MREWLGRERPAENSDSQAPNAILPLKPSIIGICKALKET